MDPALQGKEKRHKKWPKLVIRCTVYVVLSLLLLYETTHCSLVEECSGTEAPEGALSHSDYETIVKHGSSRKAQSHRVVLVTLSSGIEPEEVLNTICLQRLFTARLIKRLNDLNVSVIAFDKSYGAHTCPLDGAETQALIKGIETSRAVITRGLATVMLDNKQTVSSVIADGKEKKGKREVCLHETEALDLPIPASRAGLLRLDADTRRVPLQWPVFQKDSKNATVMDSFALATARAADPQALDTPVLQQALDSGMQPYSTTIPFPGHSALAILCGRNAPRTANWRECSTDEGWNDMNGAIVVVGNHDGDDDKHPSIHGLIYGVDLQANYIAALLDQRYYLPLFETVGNGAIIVTFFVGLQVLLWKFGPLRAGITAGILWIILVVVSIGIFAFRGYLLTVWVEGITFGTILVSCMEHWVAKME